MISLVVLTAESRPRLRDGGFALCRGRAYGLARLALVLSHEFGGDVAGLAVVGHLPPGTTRGGARHGLAGLQDAEDLSGRIRLLPDVDFDLRVDRRAFGGRRSARAVRRLRVPDESRPDGRVARLRAAAAARN